LTRAASRAGSVRESRSDPLGLFILCRSHWRAWALLGDGASPRWDDCRGDPISGSGRVCGRLRLHPCGNRPRACGRWLGRGSEAIPTSSDGVPSGQRPRPAELFGHRQPPVQLSRVLGGQRDPGRQQDQGRVVHDCCRAAARPARTARSRAASGRHSRSNATAPRVRKFLTPPQGHSRPSQFPRAALTLPRLQATHDRVPACHNG
jgi:hypothetical protein